MNKGRAALRLMDDLLVRMRCVIAQQTQISILLITLHTWYAALMLRYAARIQLLIHLLISRMIYALLAVITLLREIAL